MLLNTYYEKKNGPLKTTPKMNSPWCQDSGTVFVKILQRAVFEKMYFKVYVVIYLMKNLKFLKNSYLSLFDP